MKESAVWKFFARVMVYLAPVLLLMLGMEILQRKLPNDYSYKKHQLESKLGEIETLILGTSHTYMGINPALFEGTAFNLASTAQTLYFDRFLFEKYAPDMPKLKRLILPVSYSSLGSESYLNPGDFNKSYHYAFFYGSDAFIKKLAPRRFSLVSLFTVKRSIDRSIDFYFEGDDLVECNELGWYAGDEAPKPLQKSGETTGQLHDSFYSEDLVPINTAHVAAILQSCKAANIEVYLVSMPMYSSYMEHVTSERYEVMQRTVDSLSQAYQSPYFNYTYDPGFKTEDYFDSNHLNEQGANTFTKKLMDAIREKETINKIAEASR